MGTYSIPFFSEKAAHILGMDWNAGDNFKEFHEGIHDDEKKTLFGIHPGSHRAYKTLEL